MKQVLLLNLLLNVHFLSTVCINDDLNDSEKIYFTEKYIPDILFIE